MKGPGSWAFEIGPLAYHWGTSGEPWGTSGVPLGCHWDDPGLPRVYPWCATRVTPLGCFWVTPGVSLGDPRELGKHRDANWLAPGVSPGVSLG